MGLSDDKALPDSYDESTAPVTGAPVRFVWEHTILRSAHNRRMRRRIVDDLEQRFGELYPDVPPQEAGDRKRLEATFDQAFTTLRTKFRSQRNSEVAHHERRRDQSKSAKQRRLGRKKTVSMHYLSASSSSPQDRILTRI
jgi:hypothetical protein